MFAPNTFLLAVVAFTGAATARLQYRGSTSNVTILSIGKSNNSTGGEGFVAAGGKLSPFGDIGAGCGVNWQNGVAYGGGLNAGSADFGLGGGYKITPDTMEIGTGIGINGANNSTGNVNFKGSKNGTFELRFESTSQFACTPSSEGEKWVVICSTIASGYA